MVQARVLELIARFSGKNRVNCAICGAASTAVFRKTVLFEYDVDYFRCDRCGYLQTQTPHWLDEAYSSAIASLDVGLVQRNIVLAERIEEIILTCFETEGRFLDYAGGYGLFVRLMRDRGFDFFWTDRFCANLFARFFSLEDDPNRGSGFDLVTAIEVMEHLEEPYRELDKMLGFSKSLLVTTELVPEDDLENWCYLSPETGQHVGFYTLDALQVIADRYRLTLVSDGEMVHLLTDRPITELPKMRSGQPRWKKLLGGRGRKPRPPSRLMPDFEFARGILARKRDP